MFTGFHFMEESLKNFLIESQDDNYTSRNATLYKYNNLKVYMDPKKSSTPHIIIRIGISEVMYDIISWEKISGGLGTDERLIKRWFDRNLENLDFQVNWRDVNRSKQVTMSDNDMDD